MCNLPRIPSSNLDEFLYVRPTLSLTKGFDKGAMGAPLVVMYSSPSYEKVNQGADDHHYCDYDNNECP